MEGWICGGKDQVGRLGRKRFENCAAGDVDSLAVARWGWRKLRLRLWVEVVGWRRLGVEGRKERSLDGRKTKSSHPPTSQTAYRHMAQIKIVKMNFIH